MEAPSFTLVTDLGMLRERVAQVIGECTDPRRPSGRAFAWDVESGYHGVDREKASLHPEENFIAGISFTNSRYWACYVPVAHDSGPNLPARDVAEALYPLLAQARAADGTPLGTCHGGKFDLRTARRWFNELLGTDLDYRGFRLRSDSMLESYALGSSRRHGLKELTEEQAARDDEGGFWHKQLEIEDLFENLTAKQKKQIRFNGLDPTDPKVLRYVCEDTVYALAHHRRRYPVLRRELAESPNKGRGFIWKLEMAVLPVVCEMEDEGIFYDWAGMREGARKARDFAERYLEEIRADFGGLRGSPLDLAFNFGSPQQLGRLLYEDCSMPVKHRTKTGRPGTDAKVALKHLSKTYPEVAKYLEWKKVVKLYRDYLEKFEDTYSFAADGRAHASLIQHGVPAGRFACGDPNYQQSPKYYHYALRDGTEFELNFRDYIGAPPGWYQIKFDLAQCLAPETRVCTSDLRWVPIGKVEVGDELIGFDELAGKYGPGRQAKLKPAVVEHTRRIIKDCYRVTLSDGREVVASADHQWVEVGTSAGSTKVQGVGWRGTTYVPAVLRKWKRTDELVPGKSRLCSWVSPWSELPAEAQRDGGWLAGFADGEGWAFGQHHGKNTALYVGLAQNPGPVWDYVEAVCARLGYGLSKIHRHPSGSKEALRGNRVEKRYLDYESSVRFLGQCRPVRIGAQSRRFWEGRQTYTQSSASVEVTAVEHLGPREVVAVQTSTRTYVAEGLLSHNCELRAVAGLAKEDKMLRAFELGTDVHKVTASLIFGVPVAEVTRDQRDVGKTLGLALVYGLTESGLADRLGITYDEAVDLFAAFHAAYPKIKEWTDRTVRDAADDRCVTTWWGRRVPVWGFAEADEAEKRGQRKRSRQIWREAQRTAGNAPVQGSATGDYMKLVMVRTEAALRKAGLKDRVRLVMNVHDELGWYVRNDTDFNGVIKVLEPAVIFPVPGWPPLVAEWKAGRRWGSMRDLEKSGGRYVFKAAAEKEPVIDLSEEDEDDVAPAPVLPALKEIRERVGPGPVPEGRPVAVAERVEQDGPGAHRLLAADHPVRSAARGVRAPAAPARVVVVEPLTGLRTSQVPLLVGFLERRPGGNTVLLRLPTGDVTSVRRSGIGPADEAELSVLLGAVSVTYDEGSVDLGEAGEVEL